MYGYQTTDFTHNVCEVVKVHTNNGNLEATIYRKPDGGEAF